MSDKIEKLITLYGKITGEQAVPDMRPQVAELPVKKREPPIPYPKSGRK